MSGPLGSSQWMYASGFEAEQSLRLDDTRASHLQFTPAVEGNRRTFTVSAWIKRSVIQNGTILSAGADNNNAFRFRFNGAALQAYDYNGSANQFDWQLETNADLRDHAAWYHVMLAVDTTQGTNTNRIKLYVNGTQQTDLATSSYPSQNYDTEFNQASQVHRLGETHSEDSALNGYLAEVYLLDGVVGTPADFGETGSNGQWIPKEYDGSFGTNGWYLPFKQDYSVEGFNVVTYRGNGATKYVGGVGFEPNFVWIKSRETGSDSHQLYDTNRGIYNSLKSDATDAESARTGTGLLDFTSDGFTLGNFQYNNRNTSPYVAWCWDMGNTFGLPVAITANGSVAHSTSRQKFGASSIEIGGGSDHLTAPDDPKFDFQGDFTVECWVSRDGNQIDNGAIISKYEVAGWMLATDVNEKILWWDQASGTQTLLTSTTVLDDNTWYHVAVVRKNDAFHLFINGTLEASKSYDYDYSISNMNTVLYVGRYSAANAGSFIGYVDDIRISNKARYETTGFTAPSSAFTNDENTILLIASNTSNGSTTFVDSAGAVQNEDGTRTSYVSANTTYGQSIVSATMPSSGTGLSLGHGLSSKPDMIMLKSRSETAPWYVWHKGLDSETQSYLKLNETDTYTGNTSVWNNTAPTSSVFSTVSNYSIGNDSKAIAYCFHDVTGYSKFDSYTGNGSTTGPSITLGFRPSLLVIKSATVAESWFMMDTTRTPVTTLNTYLQAEQTADESTTANANTTISDTGFQIKTAHEAFNKDGDTYIYMAFADKREYGYWLDQSGQNNDWAQTDVTESDISLDNPSNSFCTMNPDMKFVTNTGQPTEGMLKTTCGSTNVANKHVIGSTMAVATGKWYWEVLLGLGSNSDFSQLGVIKQEVKEATELMNTTANSSNVPMDGDYGWGIDAYNGTKEHDNTQAAYFGARMAKGTIVGVALDMDNSKIYFSSNNAWIASGDPAAGSNAAYTNLNGTCMPWFSTQDNAAASLTVNFGQDSSFGSVKVSQGFQDGGGVGDFFFEPPTGFLALCTKNLPSPSITPSSAFKALLYTGTGSNQAVSGVGFQPDLLWVKNRATTGNNLLYDVVRGGDGTNLEGLRVDRETVASVQGDEMRSLDSDGFTTDTGEDTNGDGHSIISYNWKAGTGNTAFSESGNNPAGTHNANQAAGFSIVSYVGTGAAGTVSHGLSAAPEMIWIKNRDVNDSWAIYYGDNTDYLVLDTTAATADAASYFNDTSPTTSVFTVNTAHSVNADAENYIAYCWHSVAGFSKIGVYTGNGNADGAFVYCDFKPAFVFIKRINSSGQQAPVYDSARNTFNPANESIKSEDSVVAQTNQGHIDLLSNGFKAINSEGSTNTDGGTYLFYAIAEIAQKHSTSGH